MMNRKNMSKVQQEVWYKKGTDLLKEIQNTVLSDDEVAVWYLGQCGFVVKQKSIIYIDPVLNDIRDDSGNSIRRYEPPFSPEMVKADYVFCTHDHIDHMLEETVKGIYKNNSDMKFLIPGACEKTMIGYNISRNNIMEVGIDSDLILPNFTVTGISTAHPTHEKDDKGKVFTLAYNIQLGDIHLLHLGDTYLTDELLRDLKQLHAPHIFMVPINGIDYFRSKSNILGNLSTTEAAILAEELAADITIPMHYDMIKGNTYNPLRFIEDLREFAPGRKFRLPSLGERIIYRL